MDTFTHFSCKRLYLILACIAVSFISPSYSRAQGIIPQPQHQIMRQGTFVINENTKFYTNLRGKEKKMMKKYLSSLSFQFQRGGAKERLNTVRMIIEPDKKKTEKATSSDSCREGYKLNITPQEIEIKASTGTGLFYGFQSVLQLSEQQSATVYSVPCAEITDYPRFPYRGLMLDVSRHFFPKKFVFKQIDALAYYKLNYLHLHLTDGGGWRIQIKKYPKLTEETAYRPESDWRKWWSNGNRMYCKKDDAGAYGGYYTQHDIRDIVKYAAIHHITVIPEIEMPGHSDEVMAAYPELSCSGKPYTNSSLCVGKEITFRFLENVLKEVMKLFPSEYIHIGGDEASKTAWENCPLCRKRMEEEHLKNVEELQSYLICRIERFLNAHGRKLLGWDEILEGKLAPNATVMSWRGVTGGIAAIKAGHHAIMTPESYCYLDHYQDAPGTQPLAIGGYLPLDKVYSYNPVPDSLSSVKNLFYGVQGNLWTEFVPTPEHAEYMIYPRILAIAEVGWTLPAYKKPYSDFHVRALNAINYLSSKGYHPFDLSKETGHRPEASQFVSHEALGKKVTYNAPYSNAYKADGEQTLTDGKLGDWDYNSGRWQGFISHDRIDVTIDMEKVTELHDISAEFIQSSIFGVYAPAEIIISTSEDGINYSPIDKQTYTVDKNPAYFIKTYKWQGNASGRYIRYQAHADKKYGGWLFTDEIIVNRK